MPTIADTPFDEPIEIAEHEPEWEDRYQAEAARLHQLVVADGRFIDVYRGFEHFGSTSVPGLPAKPVIGLMCGVTEWEPPDGLIELFQEAGYLYFGQMGRRQRQYLRRRDGQHFNIHIVVHEGDVWTDNLLFREFLSCHDEERDAYAQVKLGALEESGGQLSGYGSIKSQHMRKLLQRAQLWHECGRDDAEYEAHRVHVEFQKQVRRIHEAERADAQALETPRTEALESARLTAAIAGVETPETIPHTEFTAETPIATVVASVIGVPLEDVVFADLPAYTRQFITNHCTSHGIALPPLTAEQRAAALMPVEAQQRHIEYQAATARQLTAQLMQLDDSVLVRQWLGTSAQEVKWRRYSDEQIIQMATEWQDEHGALEPLDAETWWMHWWGEQDEFFPGAWNSRPTRPPSALAQRRRSRQPQQTPTVPSKPRPRRQTHQVKKSKWSVDQIRKSSHRYHKRSSRVELDES